MEQVHWCSLCEARTGCCEPGAPLQQLIVGALNASPDVCHHIVRDNARTPQLLGKICNEPGIQAGLVQLFELPAQPPVRHRTQCIFYFADVIGRKTHIFVQGLPYGDAALSTLPLVRIDEARRPSTNAETWKEALRGAPVTSTLAQPESPFRIQVTRSNSIVAPGLPFQLPPSAVPGAHANSESTCCEFKHPSGGRLQSKDITDYLDKFVPAIRASANRPVHLILGVQDESCVVVGATVNNLSDMEDPVQKFLKEVFPHFDSSYLRITQHCVALPSPDQELVYLAELTLSEASFAISCLSGNAWRVETGLDTVDLLVDSQVLSDVSRALYRCRDLASLLPNLDESPTDDGNAAESQFGALALKVALGQKSQRRRSEFDWLARPRTHPPPYRTPEQRFVFDLEFNVPMAQAACMVFEASERPFAHLLHMNADERNARPMPLLSLWLRLRRIGSNLELPILLSPSSFLRILVVPTSKHAQLAQATLEHYAPLGVQVFDATVNLEQPDSVDAAKYLLLCHPTRPRCIFADATLLRDPATAALVNAKRTLITPAPTVVALCTVASAPEALQGPRVHEVVLYDAQSSMPESTVMSCMSDSKTSLCRQFPGCVEPIPDHPLDVCFPQLVRDWLQDTQRRPPRWDLVRMGAVVKTELISNLVQLIQRNVGLSPVLIDLRKLQPGCGASAALRATGFQLCSVRDVYCIKALPHDQLESFWQVFQRTVSRPTLLLLDQDMVYASDFVKAAPSILRHPVAIVRVLPETYLSKVAPGPVVSVHPNRHIVTLSSVLSLPDTKAVCTGLATALKQQSGHASPDLQKWAGRAYDALTRMAKSELAPDDRHLYVIALSACRGEYVPAEEFVSDRYDALVAIEPAMEGHLFRLARLLALLSALCGDLDAVWMAPNEWEALMDDQSPDAAAFCGLVRYDGHLHFLHPFIARLFLSQIDYGGRTEHWREGQPVPRHFLYNEWHASLSVLCQHLVTRRAPTGQPSSIVERLLSRREDDALFFPPLVQNIVNFSSHEPIAQRSELLDDVLGEFTPEHKLQYPRFSIDEPFRLLIRSRANRFWGKTLPNYLRLAVEDARQAWKLLAPTEHDNLSRNNLVTALYALLSHLGPEPQTQVELLLEEFVGHCRHLCVSRVPLQLQRYFYKLRERGFSLPDHMTGVNYEKARSRWDPNSWFRP